MSKTPGYIILVFLVVAACIAGWRSYERDARAAKAEAEILKVLTAEDMRMILESHFGDGAELAAFNENAEARQRFFRGLREHLALAADARREGLADTPEFKINFEYKSDLLLADLYGKELPPEERTPSAAELDAVWADAANDDAFRRDMETMRSIQSAAAEASGSNITPGPLAGESLELARSNWAKTKVLSNMAKSDAEFMNRPELKLRSKILEAGILSSDLLRTHWSSRIRATDEEISAWLAARPEYGPDVKKDKAEHLLERVLSGEKISELAKEFTEYMPSRDAGGLMQNISAKQIEPAVRAALDELTPAQVLDRVVETELGFYILQLEERKGSDDSSAAYRFRQILIQKKFAQPNVGTPEIPAPFMTAKEIAKAEIEQEKRNKFVAESIERNGISLPDDLRL